MSAGHRPHASVLSRRVVDREPEADHAARLGPQIRVVGVAGDFTADVRLLEDVHRLQQQRVAHADVTRNRSKLRRAAERVEHRIEIVHRMPEFVERQVRLRTQTPRLVERILFKKATDLFAARQEVVVARVLRFAVGGEHCGLFWRRHVFFGKLHGALAQGDAVVG